MKIFKNEDENENEKIFFCFKQKIFFQTLVQN